MTIRQAIEKELKRQKKSRHWLAMQTKMYPSTLYNFFNGKFDLTGKKLDKIAKALGMELRPKE